MYNRYLRNDDGVYTRIPMQDAPQDSPPPRDPPPPPPHGAAGNEQFLHRLLGKFNLKDIDAGDILLLLILFFLFEEKADDELLIALGLLLIL